MLPRDLEMDSFAYEILLSVSAIYSFAFYIAGRISEQ